MTTKKQREASEALEQLRKMISPGDKIYGIVRSVSRSGMSRVISFYKIGADGPVYLTGYMAKALDYRRADDGLKVNGCGMDMIFDTVYNLGRVLWPNGGPCQGTRRYQEERLAREKKDRGMFPGVTWESDGGYLLKSDSL